MWPSGSRPLGKSDNRTNSGRVSNSSRERVNLVPLHAKSALACCDLIDFLTGGQV